jgi:hypothetical protein
MKKLDIKTLNQTNQDIWAKLAIAYDQKNWALIAKNLKRLRSLQGYYLSKLNFAEAEIRELRIMLNASESQVNQYEREWMREVSKKTGTLDLVNDRLNELFGL